jgi:hypothetical protein
VKTPTQKEVNDLINNLRALAPNRPLTYGESVQVARLQAERLRGWAQATDTAEIDLGWLLNQSVVPVHLVPSHVLNEKSGLTTDLIGDRLQIFINESEPHVRQRFSLLHEFKHVLDFTNSSNLHKNLGLGDDALRSTRVELIANEFAAQVLMPVRLVKHVWFKTQNLPLTANTFNVSPEAMRTRLMRLGLIERPDQKERRYFREAGLLHDVHVPTSACAA